MVNWTPDQDAVIKELFESGKSAGQIADQFGDTSRSAVSARLARLGLKRGDKPVNKDWRKKYVKPPVEKILRLPPEPPKLMPVVPPKLAPHSRQDGPHFLLDLKSAECRYSIGMINGVHHFCALPTGHHEVMWCPFHYRIIYPMNSPYKNPAR